MSRNNFALLFVVLFLFLIQGCAYGIMDDTRLLDTMSSDKSMATKIKADLLKNNFSEGFSIAVYCYYKHVFLVGEIPEHMQQTAVRIAESKHPRSVTAHWFTPLKSQQSDLMLSGRLRSALINAKGLSSTRVDTEVNAGRVVLLGVVESEHERNTAIRAAKHVNGVANVTSYLFFPPKTHGENTAPVAKEVKGEPKPKENVQKLADPKNGQTFEERTL